MRTIISCGSVLEQCQRYCDSVKVSKNIFDNLEDTLREQEVELSLGLAAVDHCDMEYRRSGPVNDVYNRRHMCGLLAQAVTFDADGNQGDHIELEPDLVVDIPFTD